MSAPFAPGDVVVCVDTAPRGTSPFEGSLTRLKKDSYYRVSACIQGRGHWIAFIDGVVSTHPNGGWQADRFRKVDAADEQFAARIRACKPERVPC